MGFDTPHKKAILGKKFEPASSLHASHPKPLRREHFAKAGRAQDTHYGAARRQLVSSHPGGSAEWLVDNAATGQLTQGKPLTDDWRIVGRSRTEMFPGCVLMARAIAVPSGATEYDSGGAGWPQEGVGGAVRFVIDYANVDANTDQVTVRFELQASAEDDGAEDTSMTGMAWRQLSFHTRAGIKPDGVANNPAEAKKWSEWTTITASVEHRGGARVVHASLTEQPFEHVADHDQAEVSVNGVPPSLSLIDRYPVEETADGGTYQDDRFGVKKMLEVAEIQRKRLGQRIWHWSSHGEALTGITDTEANPIEITSTTPVRVAWRDANANTSWDANAPGFDVPPSRRAPENMRSRLGGTAATAPMRIRVFARFDGAGGNTGYFKIQTSPRSWCTIEITEAVSDTARWRTITHFGETNLHSDDTYCIGQEFAWVTGGTLEIWDIDVSYGDFTTGA